MNVCFRKIETGLGTIFFGPMWASEEKFITDCNRRNIKIICNLLEKSHGDIANAKEMWYPITNYTNPDMIHSFLQYIRLVISEVKSGKNIFIHCQFGIGRTSFALKTIMMELGMTEDESIAIVNKAYSIGIANIQLIN
jgi:hypothetical protein